MKAVIIAAGCGSRLWKIHRGIPKTLLKIDGRHLIDDILDKTFATGIQDVVIITGYKRNVLEEAISKFNSIENRISCKYQTFPETFQSHLFHFHFM